MDGMFEKTTWRYLTSPLGRERITCRRQGNLLRRRSGKNPYQLTADVVGMKGVPEDFAC
jgi:hypothetical protein